MSDHNRFATQVPEKKESKGDGKDKDVDMKPADGSSAAPMDLSKASKSQQIHANN